MLFFLLMFLILLPSDCFYDVEVWTKHKPEPTILLSAETLLYLESRGLKLSVFSQGIVLLSECARSQTLNM